MFLAVAFSELVSITSFTKLFCCSRPLDSLVWLFWGPDQEPTSSAVKEASTTLAIVSLVSELTLIAQLGALN